MNTPCPSAPPPPPAIPVPQFSDCTSGTVETRLRGVRFTAAELSVYGMPLNGSGELVAALLSRNPLSSRWFLCAAGRNVIL